MSRLPEESYEVYIANEDQAKQFFDYYEAEGYYISGMRDDWKQFPYCVVRPNVKRVGGNMGYYSDQGRALYSFERWLELLNSNCDFIPIDEQDLESLMGV